MELRGQEKNIGMPMGYSTSTLPPHHQPNQDSSSKLSSERRRNNDQTGFGSTVLNPTQTLDHHHHLLHQQLNLHHQQQQQQQRNAQRRDSNSDPDQDPDPEPEPDPDPIPQPGAAITGASNSKAAPPPQPTSGGNSAAVAAGSVRYRECQKNHAASMGSHVLDGCGEFIPSGEEGSLEALKCGACDCHRNFHRREVEGEPPIQSGANSYYPYNPNRNRTTTPHLAQVPQPFPPPPPPLHHHRHHSHIYPHGPTAGMMMAFGGGGVPAESTSEDLNMFHSNAGAQAGGAAPFSPSSKKRFRTKFTQEQKDKMLELGERLGWRIQKQDEQEVQQFCAEVGVKRQVFKVWMHNNKQAMKKKQL